jgi:hypothetical protein
VKVIDTGGEFIIQASGSEVTILEDAIYHRALSLEGHDSEWKTHRRGDLLKQMLDAVRRPHVARRA